MLSALMRVWGRWEKFFVCTQTAECVIVNMGNVSDPRLATNNVNVECARVLGADWVNFTVSITHNSLSLFSAQNPSEFSFNPLQISKIRSSSSLTLLSLQNQHKIFLSFPNFIQFHHLDSLSPAAITHLSFL